MKRRELLLAALVCLACLAGCRTEPEAYPVSAVQAMTEANAFSEELEEVDADTAFLLYQLESWGLAREDLTGCAVSRSAGATCEEGAVLVLAGEEQAEKAMDALEDYVKGQIDSNVDYRPDEVPKLESALLDRRGNTVLLAVAADVEAAKKAVE